LVLSTITAAVKQHNSKTSQIKIKRNLRPEVTVFVFEILKLISEGRFIC